MGKSDLLDSFICCGWGDWLGVVVCLLFGRKKEGRELGVLVGSCDENDGRRVLVQLTNKGIHLIEGATEARFETAMDALENLSKSQRESLSNLLRLVLIEQENPPTSDHVG